MPLTESQRKFLTEICDAAVSCEIKTGLPAEITVAQAILESGWGRYVPRGSYNLFGVKDTSRYPGSVQASTIEYIDGKPRTVLAKFEAYPSYQEAIADHARLLTTTSIYKPHFDLYRKTGELNGFIWAISAHYATDPGYATKLMAILNGQEVKKSIEQARARAAVRMALANPVPPEQAS